MESSSQLNSLQQHIQSLTELHTRVQTIHQFPSLLLRSHVASMPPLSLRAEFQQLKEIKDTLLSDQIQDALSTARDSEKEDKEDIHFDGRRESRKRRWSFHVSRYVCYLNYISGVLHLPSLRGLMYPSIASRRQNSP